MIKQKEQFMLRVRRGSEIDKVLQALSDGAVHTVENMQDAGGLKRSFWIGTMLSKWFDNVTTDRRKRTLSAQYINVRPQQVQHIDTAEFNVIGASAQAVQQVDDTQYGALLWPDAPPMCEKFDGFRKPADYATITAMVKLGKHISLEGPPGTGKSTAVEEMAVQFSKPLVSVGASAGLRKRDLIGTQEIVNGTSKFAVAEFAAAVVNGWWCKIDEVNAADPDVIMLLNSLTASPYTINIHGMQYPVHQEFRLFVTYNYGLVGTKPLPQSFKDRFYPIKWTFPSEAMLRKILIAHGMPVQDSNDPNVPNWTSYVLAFAQRMWDAHVRGQMRYQISTRRLIDAVALMNAGLCSEVKHALKMAVIQCIDAPMERKAANQILGGL